MQDISYISVCVYIYICVCVCVCGELHFYMGTEDGINKKNGRERERDRERE